MDGFLPHVGTGDSGVLATAAPRARKRDERKLARRVKIDEHHPTGMAILGSRTWQPIRPSVHQSA